LPHCGGSLANLGWPWLRSRGGRLSDGLDKKFAARVSIHRFSARLDNERALLSANEKVWQQADDLSRGY
jgi:hypothetical protein